MQESERQQQKYMVYRKMSKKTNMARIDPYQQLANAIVAFAAKDYRKTLRWLKRNPKSASAHAELTRLEQFFRSEWYEVLTRVDGEWLMTRIKEDCDYDG